MKHVTYTFDWADLAFSSKKPLSSLWATFIAAPRELSAKRFTELIKIYLPHSNVLLGIAKEPYIAGFENQPQFETLRLREVEKIITKVNSSPSKHKIYTLQYFQRETKYILEKLNYKKAVFVRGSWKHSFHMNEAYYVLTNRKIDYELVSPFADEDEARSYEKTASKDLETQFKNNAVSETEIIKLLGAVAQNSFDYTFQTGVILAKRTRNRYIILATSFNKVVPFQTYAMHYGAEREKHFSPANDLNHYDTVHAEVELIIKAQKEKLDLKNTTLFINLMPCPTCARMFSETDIKEFVYISDHSDGYAARFLQTAGKQIRRLI